MADTKLSGLAAQTALVLADQRLTNDVSDTTMGAGGTDKQLTEAAFLAQIRGLLTNVSTARVINGAGATDTYLTGSSVAIPSGYPVVGTTYRLRFDVAKTAAGTATPIIIVRIGTLGTTSDAAICTFTFAAGTAVADVGTFDLEVSFRTVGAGTSAVLVGDCRLTSNLTTTGLSNAKKSVVVVSSGFNSTTASLIVGASYNGGTSAVHTVERVRAELIL